MPESEHPRDAPEAWIQAGFEALAVHLVILDARGIIMAVNEAWKEFGRTNHAPPSVQTGVGLNYLDVCRLLQESQARLHSMALVHDLLQQADNVARINLGQYAARLIEELARLYAVDPARITLETALEDVWVGLDTATPCGLLLHELLANCFEHAFPEGQAGRVRVALQTTAEQTLMLRIGDTGCGFPENLDFRATNSLGLQLVCALAEQLQGTIALEQAEGTHFLITFPLAERTTFLPDN